MTEIAPPAPNWLFNLAQGPQPSQSWCLCVHSIGVDQFNHPCPPLALPPLPPSPQTQRLLLRRPQAQRLPRRHRPTPLPPRASLPATSAAGAEDPASSGLLALEQKAARDGDYAAAEKIRLSKKDGEGLPFQRSGVRIPWRGLFCFGPWTTNTLPPLGSGF